MAIKVEMVSNTNQCFIDCETVYNITAEDEKFVFDENNYWFEFGDNKNETSRHAKDVDNLQNFEILYPVIEQVSDVEGYCDGTITIKDESSNESTETNEVCNYKTRLKYYNITIWEKLIEKQPFTLKPQESITIKIKGKKFPTGKVDNVLVLLNPEEDKYVKYSQWIWWNAVWANRTNLVFNNSIEGDNLTGRIIINNTLSLGCAKLNISDLRVVWQNTTTAEERAYYIHNFTNLGASPSNKTIVLYFNATNKVGTHYVYCGNNEANSSTANGFQTFYLFDDFDDASFNASKWNTTGSSWSSLTEASGVLSMSNNVAVSGIASSFRQSHVTQDSTNFPAFRENDTVLVAWDSLSLHTTASGGCVANNKFADIHHGLINSSQPLGDYANPRFNEHVSFYNHSGIVNTIQHGANQTLIVNTTALTWTSNPKKVNLTEITKYNTSRVNFTQWSHYAQSTIHNGTRNDTRRFRLFHYAGVFCSGVGGAGATTSEALNWVGVGNATSANISQGLTTANAMDLQILSQSTPNPVFEGSVGSFTSSINVSIDQNFYNNISMVNFTYNGTVYTNNPVWFISNSTFLNTTFFNITLNVPLITYNSTNITYSWSFMQQGNLSDGLVAITPTNTTTIVWTNWINNVTWASPVFSGTTNTFLLNLTCTPLVNCGLNQSRNLTIEYNGVNQTLALLTNNQSNSGWMEYQINITAPVVTNSIVVNWTAWVNITFSNGSLNNMFLTRRNSSSIRIMNGTQIVVSDGDVSSNNFDSPVFETSIQNYTLAVFNSSLSIVNVNFSYDGLGLIIGTSAITNSSTGNVTNFTTALIIPLVEFNQTNLSLQWNYTLSNGDNKSSNSTNQTVLWAYYVNNVTWTTPVTEGASNNFIFNVSKHVPAAYLNSSFYINTTIEYNNTNQSLGVLIDNQTTFEVYNVTMTAPLGADIIHNWTAWLNVTENTFAFSRRNRSLTQFVNGTQLVIGDGTIFNTTWNTPVFETSLANFTINVSNTTLPVVNVMFGWNSTVVLGSSISNLSTSNGTIFNTSLRLPLVSLNLTNISFVWNWTMGSGQNRTSNNTTQQVLWAHYPNRLLISGGVTEGDSQTATVNVTKHLFIGGTTRTVNVEYNGTNISTALVTNVTGYSDYNATFTTPLVLIDTTVQAKGWLNVSFGSNSYIRNTSNSSQLIININITAGTNCTNVTGFAAVLNFTFHDEFTNQTLAENGSSQITIWNLTQSNNQTFGFKFFNTTFHTICLQPPVNFTGNYFLQYENWTNSTASYPEREFWKRNQSIDNFTDQYHLYSILLSNSTDITFNVADSNGDPASNVIVEAFKYNISNNSFVQVDSGVTDFDGKTRLRLYRADDYYKIVARDGGGQLVLETSLFKLLFTEYFLRLEPVGLTTIGTVIQLKNIPHNLTFDNGTMRAVLTWNDVMNVSGQSCLEITNMTGNNTGVIVNKQCSTNISGSFQFDFTGFNGSYVAKYVTGTNSFLIDAIDVLLGGFRNLGRSGLFMAFMLIGTFTAVGVVINPTLGLIFFAVGFIGTWMIGLLQISWLPFTGVLAIVLITAFILKKDII